MTVSELNEEMLHRLAPRYGEGEARAMLRVIWEWRRHWQPVDVVMHAREEVGPALTEDFRSIAGRLLRDEPLQYVLGEARFFGLTLRVNRDTLIPRPETEGLVQLILDDFGSRSDLRVTDVGTGSGAIALALARNLPFPEVTAIDISRGALDMALENARLLHVNISAVCRDILADPVLDGPQDIVVSNPPYVLDSECSEMDDNVLDYEPLTAIFAPSGDPLAFYRVIAGAAMKALVPGGGLYFELNPLTAQAVSQMAEETGFSDVELLRDIHGRLRYLKAVKHEKR